MLSVRFEVGVSLLLAPVRADKRGPKAPFPLVEIVGNTAGDLQESTRRSSGGSHVLLKALQTRLILKFKTNQILPENIQSEYVYFNLTVVEVA